MSLIVISRLTRRMNLARKSKLPGLTFVFPRVFGSVSEAINDEIEESQRKKKQSRTKNMQSRRVNVQSGKKKQQRRSSS